MCAIHRGNNTYKFDKAEHTNFVVLTPPGNRHFVLQTYFWKCTYYFSVVQCVTSECVTASNSNTKFAQKYDDFCVNFPNV